MQHRRLLVALGLSVAALAAASPARAEQRSFNFLTSGNGHGFQIYDAQQKKITQYLEHPYRYLRSNGPMQEGVSRRNLAFDVFMGLRGGGGSGWLNAPDAAPDPEYLDQSNIIHAPATLKGVTADSYYFAPFGLEENVLVGLLHAPGASNGYVNLNFHMGVASGETPDANGEATRASSEQGAIVETGPGGGAMIYVPLTPSAKGTCTNPFGGVGADYDGNVACSGNDVAVGIEAPLASDWFGFAAAYVDDPSTADATATAIKTWAAGRAPDKILSDAQAEFEAWRKPAPDGSLCSDDEKKVWRQGEAVLRMGQVREKLPGLANYGMMLASLPPGEWHTGWVRDGTYSIVALSRMGHYQEAKDALMFMLNATPIDEHPDQLNTRADYRISLVRYFGTGEEESDYNQDGYNVEIDGWGLFLWAARAYVEASGDTAWLDEATRSGSVYDALTGGVAAPLEANLESNGIVSADSSIWEVHKAKNRHYAYTSLAAARGFCDMAALAKKHGGDVAKYQGLATKVKNAVLGTFVEPQGGIPGSLEGLGNGHFHDGAVAEAFTWSLIDFKSATATSTLNLLQTLKVNSGGYKRNDDGLSSYDNNEWILVDLRIANALRRSGQGAAGDGVVATLVTKAASNFYLLPELYNDTPSDGQIGVYAGSIPMVGYGGGAFAMTILDRFGNGEPNDCGDGNSVALPPVSCAAVSTTPSGGPGANGGDGGAGGGAGGVPDASEIPFVDACLCRFVAGRDALPPYGIAFSFALPVVLLVRRVRRKRAG